MYLRFDRTHQAPTVGTDTADGGCPATLGLDAELYLTCTTHDGHNGPHYAGMDLTGVLPARQYVAAIWDDDRATDGQLDDVLYLLGEGRR